MFWSGAGAAFAFLVVALVARVLLRVQTLPEMLQDRLVLLLPGSIFSFLLDHLLYLGKPLFFGSLLLLLVFIGGLGGILMPRLRRRAALPILAWLVIGLGLLPLAGQGVFGGSIEVALVNLLACAAYGVAFWFFHGRDQAAASQPQAPAIIDVDSLQTAASGDRRRLIIGGLLGVVTAGLALRTIGKFPALPLRISRPGRVPDTPAVAPLPPDALAASAPGLPPAVTPTDRFYVVSKNLLDPELKTGDWRLRIGGMVSQSVTLTYADLISMPSVNAYRTLECISNDVGGDLISNGYWTGVRLADVLDRAGVKPDANALFFTSSDGFTSSLMVDQVRDPATLLVYGLNGATLPAKHGYPLRLLATGIYGMKNPKWITQIDAVGSVKPGYWQQQGWDEHGIVQTMTEVLLPADGATAPVGPVSVGGIAFAGSRGIDHVEVSTDGGSTWSVAELLPSLGPSTWTLWRYAWQPSQAGSYTVVVRSTDGLGTLQPSRRTDSFPVGATGYHQIHVRVTGS